MARDLRVKSGKVERGDLLTIGGTDYKVYAVDKPDFGRKVVTIFLSHYAKYEDTTYMSQVTLHTNTTVNIRR